MLPLLETNKKFFINANLILTSAEKTPSIFKVNTLHILYFAAGADLSFSDFSEAFGVRKPCKHNLQDL
ncbi:MAG: hypothetical protein L3J11_04030 [Draconibacterium sp.]|nr:hypothetical protein [Draconibacterium sp.]